MLPSGLTETVDDREEIARFLTQKNHFNLSGAKPSAFLPHPESKETSVSRHGREPPDRLWRLGREAAGDRNLHGAVFLSAEKIRKTNLVLDSDEPPPYHAAIRGWPWDEQDPKRQKAQQKDLAQKLASETDPLLLVEQ